MRLTRRELAIAFASSAALAQTPPAALPSAEADLQTARDQVKANAAALQQIEVPITTEPAFQFKP